MWQHVKLSEQVHPEIHMHVAWMLSKQPANNCHPDVHCTDIVYGACQWRVLLIHLLPVIPAGVLEQQPSAAVSKM